MSNLPASPDLSFLKKQAKELLRDVRGGDAPALARFRDVLPALRKTALPAADALRLSDAQLVLAREHGFRSWTELKRTVEWTAADRAERLQRWHEWAYDGEPSQRRLALTTLRANPQFFAGEFSVACAVGDEAALRRALEANPQLASRPTGPRQMPPIAAVTHSLLMSDETQSGLLRCARLLLEHGADANAQWTDERWPEWPLSAIYGAAGKTHSTAMLRLMLDAGASPDDNESLYHSLETPGSECTRMLLEAGARVSGTNAIARALDYGKLEDVREMLARGGDAREGTLLHHAILRGRSLEFIELLVQAGADLRAVKHGRASVYRFAACFGREDVLAMLREAGVEDELSPEEAFVAACARGDAAAAGALKERMPDVFERMPKPLLEMLPWLADIGRREAVRVMLEVGWPREVKAGWDATALNHAVYQGDAAMAELLLEAGADWRTEHGFKNNVVGTLAHASRNPPENPDAPCDFVGCARVLLAHGVPLPGEEYGFSAEVTAVFDEARLAGPA